VINLLDIFRSFSLEKETLSKLFNKEDLDLEGYENIKALEAGVNMPQFIFTRKNSYFDVGILGRKKYGKTINIFELIKNKELAEDLVDNNKRVVLPKGTLLKGKELDLLKSKIDETNSRIEVPNSANPIYLVKVIGKGGEIAKVVGTGDEISEEKTFFDLADLICIASSFINLHRGIGQIGCELDKDDLKNQVVRSVGDLMYNLFDNKLGGFLQDLDNKYLANISQMKKSDLGKIPQIKDFDSSLKSFFNHSPLVQLQNQNNPLSEASYTRKLSVLGLGGFSSSNTTLAARNVNSSYYGKYDLVETPEGQRVGLIHNLTINSGINKYGQVVAKYYRVENGVVLPEIVDLNSEESHDKYMAHCNIRINENNEIVDDQVIVRYQEELIMVAKEKVQFIDFSFYQLNSITSATIPFFQHNDSTRMLMASNMQRQALTLVKNQAPLVSSGMEPTLLNNSALIIKSGVDGEVKYVDNNIIIITSDQGEEKVYKLRQLTISNKNVLNFTIPQVRKGERVTKDQIIAHGNYANDNELSLGYNLRVAYLC
jgi:DNA-directed RNA polymerase subunit beta